MTLISSHSHPKSSAVGSNPGAPPGSGSGPCAAKSVLSSEISSILATGRLRLAEEQESKDQDAVGNLELAVLVHIAADKWSNEGSGAEACLKTEEDPQNRWRYCGTYQTSW